MSRALPDCTLAFGGTKTSWACALYVGARGRKKYAEPAPPASRIGRAITLRRETLRMRDARSMSSPTLIPTDGCSMRSIQPSPLPGFFDVLRLGHSIEMYLVVRSEVVDEAAGVDRQRPALVEGLDFTEARRQVESCPAPPRSTPYRENVEL